MRETTFAQLFISVFGIILIAVYSVNGYRVPVLDMGHHALETTTEEAEIPRRQENQFMGETFQIPLDHQILENAMSSARFSGQQGGKTSDSGPHGQQGIGADSFHVPIGYHVLEDALRTVQSPRQQRGLKDSSYRHSMGKQVKDMVASESARTRRQPRQFITMFMTMLEKTEWNVIFVKMCKILLNYFMDLAFKEVFGTAGRSLTGPRIPLLPIATPLNLRRRLPRDISDNSRTLNYRPPIVDDASTLLPTHGLSSVIISELRQLLSRLESEMTADRHPRGVLDKVLWPNRSAT